MVEFNAFIPNPLVWVKPYDGIIPARPFDDKIFTPTKVFYASCVFFSCEKVVNKIVFAGKIPCKKSQFA